MSDPIADQKSKSTILATHIQEGLEELERPADALFMSAVAAGLDLGFGPLFMAVVFTLVAPGWGEPLTTLLVANAYAVGFIFVVLGRSELFTEHTTLAVIPVLDGQASVAQLGRTWGVVYLGNILAGGLFAVAALTFAPAYGIADVSAFVHIGTTLVDHSAPLILGGAVFAGWLMGLLSWLVTAADSTPGRIFFVWLVTAVIGLAHLPHSIAGNIEVLAAVLVGPLGALDYLEFLALATVGNAIGGTFFVALLKYSYITRGE